MKEYTKCDAIMIGRGALGKPWIFNEILSNITNSKKLDINLEAILKICKKHIKLFIKDKASKVSVNLSKKHLSYYIKGFNGASDLRKEIMSCTTSKSILEILDKIKK